MFTKNENDLPTYTFELEYDKTNYTVEQVLKQLKEWQENLGGDSVSFLVTEQAFGVLGLFNIRSKKLQVFITGMRHSKILCDKLGIKFNPEKHRYQKDLFDLGIL